jgi:hypothetical protein
METFMRALLLLLLPLTLIVCPLAQFIAAPQIATPAPTLPTPTAAADVPAARVDLSASATRLRVGETVTLTGTPVNVGLPYYTLTLSSGASVTVTYDNQIRESLGANPQFELVSAAGAMNEVTFVLRAVAPGTIDVTISATGEVRTPEGAYSWGYGGSAPVTLTVSE